MHLARFRATCFAILTITLSTVAIATPLDDYIAKDDPAFAYGEPAKVVEADAYTASVYRMTSQHWLDESLVDRTEWWHWITVIVPKVIEGNEAMLFISGGSNSENSEPPTPDAALGQVASMTKSVLVDVKQIPNQRLKFTGEMMDKYKEKGRTEDELIEQMEKLRVDTELRNELGKRGRRAQRELLSEQKYVETYEQLVRELGGTN